MLAILNLKFFQKPLNASKDHGNDFLAVGCLLQKGNVGQMLL